MAHGRHRYCENGSLQSICRRHGKFPESLTTMYMAQVLDGLVYLHKQGVIHRDIKVGPLPGVEAQRAGAGAPHRGGGEGFRAHPSSQAGPRGDVNSGARSRAPTFSRPRMAASSSPTLASLRA